MQSNKSSIKISAILATLAAAVTSTICLPQQALTYCPECPCPRGGCYCTYDYQCVPEKNPAYQAEQRRKEEEQAREEEARRQRLEASRQNPVQTNLDFGVQHPATQLETSGQPSSEQTKTQLSVPSGFPPALVERMNQLEMAETIDPQQKALIRQRFEEMKAGFQASQKQAMPPTDVIMPGQAVPSSGEIGKSTAPAQTWMGSPEVTKFLTDTDSMLHKQGKMQFFTGPQGDTAARQLENAAGQPIRSEFEKKQTGGEQPGGTPHFGLGGGAGPLPSSGTTTQQEFTPRVQIPKPYLRKQTVPPVPPGEEPPVK